MAIQVLRNEGSEYIFGFRPSFGPFARGKWMYSIPEALIPGEYLGKWTCYHHHMWNTPFFKSSIHYFCHQAFLLDLLTLSFTPLHSNKALTLHICSVIPAVVPAALLDFPEHWLESNFQGQVLPLSLDWAWGESRGALSCRWNLSCSEAGQVAWSANQPFTSMLLQTHLNSYSAYTELIGFHSWCCSVLFFGMPHFQLELLQPICSTAVKLYTKPSPPPFYWAFPFTSSCGLRSSLSSNRDSASGLLCFQSLPYSLSVAQHCNPIPKLLLGHSELKIHLAIVDPLE